MLASGVRSSFVVGAPVCTETKLVDLAVAGAAGAIDECSPGGSGRPPREPLVAGDTKGGVPDVIPYLGSAFGGSGFLTVVSFPVGALVLLLVPVL